MPRGEKNRKLSDADIDEVVRLYTVPQPDGTWLGAPSIGLMFGVTPECVRYNLRKRGIAIRDAKEAHANGKRCGPFKHMAQFETPPLCACGCGESVRWLQTKAVWAKFVPGHRYQDAPYKQAEWLREQYITRNRSADEIADVFGVDKGTVLRYLRRSGIAIRDASAAHAGRALGDKNPAWKGGIAKWAYAPQWKRIARVIRKRDNYTCQLCGVQHEPRSKILHVHHIDGDKTNNAADNLMSVCAACHPKGKRKEAFNKLSDPHWRTKWLITRKGEVLGIDADTFITTREAADRLGVSPAHIVDLSERGRFTTRRVGHFYYVDRPSFEAFAATYQRHKKRPV